MDVLTPNTLEDALRLKAERPEAVPIQGGTDVMVEVNFDRARPPALLNLNEVEDLRGWSRRDGTLRLGAGLTYADAMEPALAGRLPALAEAARTVGGPRSATVGRSAATPGRRRRRATRFRRSSSRARRSSLRVSVANGASPWRSSSSARSGTSCYTKVVDAVRMVATS